ncbi:hypothetical protein EDE08_103325 [Bradyrhizobium sp. R2.2-H]|jgi:hypothetical protein|uniref:hypothetical protein n=1 Tax=unclassified Bradyrhizobium TaxID=2631580 RepID=UPI0010D8313C|nr:MULTISPECIES: hypothetical protein [unclassified Bradyrhizobium]TCU75108.1 hypothetical protein EDE10_103324 [Bradyrhizobium sp. Y-H1]TCU77876.1 hypothetical protein EDE08_103325 [Bradyrhizobium sp. R2.2-H]
MKVEDHNRPHDLPEKPPVSVREAVARLKAIVAESMADENKRKLYFGYFETSDGDL